ncbi:MAG: hypothetical protein JWN89_260 [Parcubacteria group bacterium]|nr:hypothetical protein [Parcubacteria group bacterium]
MKKILVFVLVCMYTLGLPAVVSAALTTGAATGDYIGIGFDPSISNIESEFTIMMWIKPNSTISTNRALVGTRPNAANGSSNMSLRTAAGAPATDISLRLAKTGGLRFDTTDAPLLPGEWTFIAVTHSESASTTNLYHGSLRQTAIESTYSFQSTVTGAPTASGGTDPFVWGNRWAPGGPTSAFTGTFAVAAIINRSISLGEVRAWQYAPRNIPGTVNLMFFGLASGIGTQPDFSGFKNIGTPVGSVTFNPVNLPFKWFKR